MAKKADDSPNAYDAIIAEVFTSRQKHGANRIPFTREDLTAAAKKVGVKAPKNLGDIIYTYRFRRAFPAAITQVAPEGRMWIVTGMGDALYEFRLITRPNLAPDMGWAVSKIHDATPEIVRRFTALNDEQAVLARIRYNRLVDLFCRCVAYSLQNHLRTKLDEIGQIEIDELYVGANRQGEHFIIPVQVKKERDQLGVSQLLQDLAYCRARHPEMRPRAIGAQMFRWQSEGVSYDRIVMIEFACDDQSDDLVISKVAERHFVLLPAGSITRADFDAAASRPEDE